MDDLGLPPAMPQNRHGGLHAPQAVSDRDRSSPRVSASRRIRDFDRLWATDVTRFVHSAQTLVQVNAQWFATCLGAHNNIVN